MNMSSTAALVCLLFANVATADPPWIARSARGMVATDSPQASKIGAEVLRNGGNAVDAAVATSFALAVARPYSTGLGGGSFTMIRFSDGRVVVQDARETAPQAADPAMYVRRRVQEPNQPPPSRYGHLAVAVPGLLRGRVSMLDAHGTVPLARLMEPAIDLAEDGLAVDEHYVTATRAILDVYEKYPSLKQSCGYVYRVHLRNGDLRTAGDKLVQPELARLLHRIASDGPEVMYSGVVAQALAESMRKGSGIISAKDLATDHLAYRTPIRFFFQGYEVLAMPPPSSAGIALAEALQILEFKDVRNVRDDADFMHLQVEALKHAFADRAQWLGDADFCDVPMQRLTSREYAASLARRIELHRASVAGKYSNAGQPDDAGTSNFCIVDEKGTVVVSVETINTEFGSLAAVDEWGLILNNEMDDFAAEPGKPNAFGLIQSDCNAIAPGKRPLSSMSPTILVKDGAPYLMLGASGGPRIISSVLNVLLHVTVRGESLEHSMTAIRPHHQWRPDKIYFDKAPPQSLVMDLTSRGHAIADESKTSIVQAIMRAQDGWIGASDLRKGGVPAGH